MPLPGVQFARAPVIKRGDSLLGSTVTSLDFSRFGLAPDGSGNLAFRYNLTNRRSGIALAIALVPEARTWLMLALVGLGLAARVVLRRTTA